MKKLSVIICTFNRSELLRHCLDSLSKQEADVNEYEIIIVDNHSTDDTQSVIRQFTQPHFLSFIEKNQGLSFARNRGAEEANSPWLLYLDDDVLVEPDLISRALEWCEREDVDSFGGTFGPWYHYGKPHWFRDEYGSMNLHYSDAVNLEKNEFLFGCIFAIRKTALDAAGGFDPSLGMRGYVIGYGEETEVQRILKGMGIKIWFDPHMVVRHAVNKERLNPRWYLRSGWALGRDMVFTGNRKFGKLNLIAVVFIAVALLLIMGTFNGIRLLISRSYYPENWMIDTLPKLMKRSAIFYYTLTNSENPTAEAEGVRSQHKPVSV